MAFRDLPHFEPGDPIPSKWANDVNWNLSRLARLQTGGNQEFRDCTPGRFAGAMSTASGGSMLLVAFEVISFDETYQIATCRITFRINGVSTAAYEDSYGQIEVYDEMLGCLFTDETEATLTGRRGMAIYMLADGSEDPYAEARWQCLELCCAS